MDSYKKRNRRHSNHYSNYQPSYCDDKHSPRESFDSNYARSSKSNSESPNSHRPIAQTTFECRVCLNTYESSKELYAHLLAAQHYRPLSRLPEEEEKFPYRKRKFQGYYCKVCFHEFDTHNELKQHLSDSRHHRIASRGRPMSNQDKSAYEHKAYSDRRRHSSSTDARSDRSFTCKNLDLIHAEESRMKDPIPYVQSYGFSVLLDESVPVQEKDIDILDGDNPGLSKVNDTNVKVPFNSSNFGIDQYCQSIITSPDDSIPVSSKIPIELSSTSDGQKEMAVIPMEPSIPTVDPRQNCPHVRPESHRTESRNLTTKWAPIYCDRPKPNLAEKRIPWKLIPIDISPSNYPDNSFSNSGMSIHRVPSPTEDLLDVSIDQLAAQLKENTGATFIPNLRMESNVSHVSFEGNILNRFNRNVLSTSANSLKESVPLQSPFSCQDAIRENEGHNVIAKTVEESEGEYFDGKLARTRELKVKEHCQLNSLSCSSPKCDYVSSAEVSRLPFKVMPSLIPRPVTDHQVEAEIWKALGSLNPMLNAEILIAPIQSSSSQVLFSRDTEKMGAPQSPVFVDEDKSQNVNLTLIAEKDVSGVESCLYQISDESVEEVVDIYSSENSSISSYNVKDKSIATEEVVDSCPSCQTLLDIRFLTIDLKTGNASITCLGCDVHIVMANVFKKGL